MRWLTAGAAPKSKSKREPSYRIHITYVRKCFCFQRRGGSHSLNASDEGELVPVTFSAPVEPQVLPEAARQPKPLGQAEDALVLCQALIVNPRNYCYACVTVSLSLRQSLASFPSTRNVIYPEQTYPKTFLMCMYQVWRWHYPWCSSRNMYAPNNMLHIPYYEVSSVTRNTEVSIGITLNVSLSSFTRYSK